MNEGLIFCCIVCVLEKELEDILEPFAFWGNKKDSCSIAVEVEGAVEIYFPMLRALLYRWVLNFHPLGHEINQGLRFDHYLRDEFHRECTEFHRPFDDPTVGVSIVENITEWEG